MYGISMAFLLKELRKERGRVYDNSSKKSSEMFKRDSKINI